MNADRVFELFIYYLGILAFFVCVYLWGMFVFGIFTCFNLRKKHALLVVMSVITLVTGIVGCICFSYNLLTIKNIMIVFIVVTSGITAFAGLSIFPLIPILSNLEDFFGKNKHCDSSKITPIRKEGTKWRQ
jgi:hypothetical protein